MPSSQQEAVRGSKPAQPSTRKTFEPNGCSRCGTQKSSSFRRDASTGLRLCNSCHCKLYRMKRKAAELERNGLSDGSNSSESADRSDSTPHRRTKPAMPELLVMQVPSHHHSLPSHASLPLPAHAASGHGGHQYTLTSHHSLPAHVSVSLPLAPPSPPRQALPDLQWRVLEECRHGGGSGAAGITATLHSAYRAQLATPCCTQRVVLGVFPKLDLTGLPGDPPSMSYPVACLVEAVAPAAAAGSAKWGGDSAGDMHHRTADHCADAVLLRTTVYGPAGALACWHEGPADPHAGEGYAPLSRVPAWSSGPGGFTLEFSAGAASPQHELFTAIHRQVSLLGSAVLHRQPVLNLAQACMGPSFCLAHNSQPAAAQAQPLGKRPAEHAGHGLHMPLPTPVAAAQQPARVHSPQQQDASPQQPSAAQQQWPTFGSRQVSPAAALAAAHAPSNQLLAMEVHPRMDGFDLPTLSAGSLPHELFDASCLDFLS